MKKRNDIGNGALFLMVYFLQDEPLHMHQNFSLAMIIIDNASLLKVIWIYHYLCISKCVHKYGYL